MWLLINELKVTIPSSCRIHNTFHQAMPLPSNYSDDFLQMDLSSEEEMLEVETVEEELDSDVMSVSSLNDNFYVKDYDDKQRARDQVIEKINSIFGCKRYQSFKDCCENISLQTTSENHLLQTGTY